MAEASASHFRLEKRGEVLSLSLSLIHNLLFSLSDGISRSGCRVDSLSWRKTEHDERSFLRGSQAKDERNRFRWRNPRRDPLGGRSTTLDLIWFLALIFMLYLSLGRIFSAGLNLKELGNVVQGDGSNSRASQNSGIYRVCTILSSFIFFVPFGWLVRW